MTHAEHTPGPRLQAAEALARATAAPYDDDEGALQQSVVDRLRERLSRSGKVCAKCGEAKPLSAYGPHLQKHDALDPRCRDCESGRRRGARSEGVSHSVALSIGRGKSL
jgi:hypothetical protein